MKINQILDKLDANQLFIPAFQREYVWKRENVKKLIDSLMREYPTWTMLTWETNVPPELKWIWQYNPMQWAVKIILDWQQRITTLYMLIRGNIPPYYKESEIIVDPRNLYVNVKTLDLQYYKPTIMQNDPCWINITDIFTKKVRELDVINSLKEKGDISREEEYQISSNYRSVEKIPDLEFLEQTIPIRASLKEAIDIFYIVNASWINLTEAELALAQISWYWPDAREVFKVKLASLKAQGFNFDLDFIIYCLLGIIYKNWSDLKKLHERSNDTKVREAWEKLDTKILDYVINILKTHAFIDYSDEINSVFALIPIIVYAYNKDWKFNETEIKKIVKWFYYSQIKQRYISQLWSKLDKDIWIVNKSENPFDDLLNIIELERTLEIHSDDFIWATIANALYALMRCYFKSNNAVCLTTGIWIRVNLWAKYSLEWDHIFPYAVLKERGYGMNNRLKYPLAQEIANRAILTQTANRSKSCILAEDYLTEVKIKFPKALALQCIPSDESLWKLDRFEDFLKARRIILASELNAFLSNITKTDATKKEATIEDIISEGENSEVEFKSSLRYDYNPYVNGVNKTLEYVVAKTISAFLNSDGGKLFIGIQDDKTILWLENDYKTVKNWNRDWFLLQLTQVINTYLGKEYNQYISIRIMEINGLDICLAEIGMSEVPVYLNSNSNKEFYIRASATCQFMDMEEAHTYIRTHFV